MIRLRGSSALNRVLTLGFPGATVGSDAVRSCRRGLDGAMQSVVPSPSETTRCYAAREWRFF